MKTGFKIIWGVCCGVILFWVFAIAVWFYPFIKVSFSFEMNVENGETLISNSDFGIQFRVQSECGLENQYQRRYGMVVWEGLLVCSGDNSKGTVHLLVTDQVEQMIGGRQYKTLENVYYDDSTAQKPILRIRSRSGKLALIMDSYRDESRWITIIDTLQAY